MIRMSLSMDNGPSSKHLAAHGGVHIPSSGDAQCAHRSNSLCKGVLLPGSSLLPWLWYLGITTQPCHLWALSVLSQEERPQGCSNPTGIPIPSPWMEKAGSLSGFLGLV